jgi:uncharacterized membrane protein (UPF0182 family)
MLPFTPSKKDNMIGWLAARSDLPHYGKLLVYKLPKEKLVYGPMQIEARVDQQTEISRELSLWDQRGSRVIRGNLLAIPISDSFIYVEPIYLEAKQEAKESTPAGQQQSKGGGGLFGKPKQQTSQTSRQQTTRTAALPELKRIIVAHGNRVTMEENLEQALNNVLEAEDSFKDKVSPAEREIQGIPSNLGVMALEHYNRAKEYLKEGDWAGYGRELEQLERILERLSREE